MNVDFLRRAEGVAAWQGVLILVGIFLLLEGFGNKALLAYDAAQVSNGQFWRLLTAHFVHLNAFHLGLNAIGLAFYAWVNQERWGAMLVWRLVYLSAGVAVLLWAFNPEVQHYVGFSGVLYGLLLMAFWRQKRDLMMFVAAILLVAWALWQWVMGAIPAEEALIGGQIVSIAHLYGLILAVIWMWVAFGASKYCMSLKKD